MNNTRNEIKAHNERTKEKYASNPDVDTNRSKKNYHIIQPTDKYRVMSESLIKQYDCPHVRSDIVRIVETLITVSPEFFKVKKKSEIRGFFEHAVDFLKKELGEDHLISAVVHMDEKTPHMHVSLCAQRRELPRRDALLSLAGNLRYNKSIRTAPLFLRLSSDS